MAKINRQQAAEIKAFQKHIPTISQTQLARVFGLHQPEISHIKLNRRWIGV